MRADETCVFLNTGENHNRSTINMSIEPSLMQTADIAAIACEAGEGFDMAVSNAFRCSFKENAPLDRVIDLTTRLFDLGAEQVMFGDANGMEHPALACDLVPAFYECFPQAHPYFYLHGSCREGSSHVLIALSPGVNWFNAGVGRINGCPLALRTQQCNICTEDLVQTLHEIGVSTNIRQQALLDIVRVLKGMLGYTALEQTTRAVLSEVER